ncbi:MAG: phosphoribosylamine--glycine ligase [Elusimicrobia bacterium]|nr:phosphoribosylamine--glycine ligase [Elusimicrobiota bacterium]
MKFLVIGNGGREHAIIWKLAQSPKVDKIYCTLGNAGISKQAEIINIKVDDFESLAKFATENKIDYTFVGPEVPLALGVVDFFNSKGLKIFGPSKKGALLEASKSFAKDFMQKYNVPTAAYHTFTDYNSAKQFLENEWEENKKVVVKADGLAAGKGVVMCQNRQQALDAIKDMMQDKAFGSAGDKIIFEQWLEGQETSVLVFVDGKHFSIMPAAQDHKRVDDGDKGLNTGGMGAYAPAPIATPELLKQVKEQVMPNIMNGLQKENIDYKGILYIGFMVDNGKPYVLEFNCRFGDPETQVILPLLETDLVDIVEHTINGTLNEIDIKWSKKSAVCVVLASGGYPEKYEKNIKISGLDTVKDEEAIVFHAGTKKDDAGNVLTSGGRVLVLTAIADDIKSAIDKVYSVIPKVTFDKMHYRKDIAQRALKWINK